MESHHQSSKNNWPNFYQKPQKLSSNNLKFEKKISTIQKNNNQNNLFFSSSTPSSSSSSTSSSNDNSNNGNNNKYQTKQQQQSFGKNRFSSNNEFDNDDDYDYDEFPKQSTTKITDVDFYEKKKFYNSNNNINYGKNKPPLYVTKRNNNINFNKKSPNLITPTTTTTSRYVQDLDSKHPNSFNSNDNFDFNHQYHHQQQAKSKQYYEEDLITSKNVNNQNRITTLTNNNSATSSSELLDWLENELDQRGIDSVIYGRHLISLLQQYPNNNSNNVNNSNINSEEISIHSDELDSGYGSITANTNLRYFGRLRQQQQNNNKNDHHQIRYCESHQKLYPGQQHFPLNSWYSSNNNSSNYSSSSLSTIKDRNTQKAPTTTKWMHKRYLQQRNLFNKSNSSFYQQQQSRYNETNSNNGDDLNNNEDDDQSNDNDYDYYNDDTIFDHHCPDCQQKSSKFTKDYRKFMLIKCLRSAVDPKNSKIQEIERFIEELCSRYDQQHRQTKTTTTSNWPSTKNSHSDWMMKLSNHANHNNRNNYNSQKMYNHDDDNDNDDDQKSNNLNENINCNDNKNSVCDVIGMKNTKITPEKILYQAKQYYDAFPALGGGTSASSYSSQSSSSISSGNNNNKSDVGGSSSQGSTSIKMLISCHQSSSDDSVFSDTVPSTPIKSSKKNEEKFMPTLVDTQQQQQQEKGWNGRKIIKNIIQNQSKLNVVSITNLDGNNGSTIMAAATTMNNNLINENGSNCNNNNSNSNNTNNAINKPTVVKLKSTLLGGKSSRTSLIVAPSSLNIGNDNANMSLLSGGNNIGAAGVNGTDNTLTTLKKLNPNLNNHYNNSNNQNPQELNLKNSNSENNNKLHESDSNNNNNKVPALAAHEMEKIYQIMPSFLNPIMKTSTTAASTTTTTVAVASSIDNNVPTAISSSSSMGTSTTTITTIANTIATTTTNSTSMINSMNINQNYHANRIDQIKPQQQHHENTWNTTNKNRFNYINQRNNGRSFYYQQKNKMSPSHSTKLTATTNLTSISDDNNQLITTQSASIHNNENNIINTSKNYHSFIKNGSDDNHDHGSNNINNKTIINKVDNNVVVDLLPNFLKCKQSSSTTSASSSSSCENKKRIDGDDFVIADDVNQEKQQQQQQKTIIKTIYPNEPLSLLHKGYCNDLTDNNKNEVDVDKTCDYDSLMSLKDNYYSVINNNDDETIKIPKTIENEFEPNNDKMNKQQQQIERQSEKCQNDSIDDESKISENVSTILDLNNQQHQQQPPLQEQISNQQSLYKNINDWLEYHENENWFGKNKGFDTNKNKMNESNLSTVEEVSMVQNWQPLNSFQDLIDSLDLNDDSGVMEQKEFYKDSFQWNHKRIDDLSTTWNRTSTLGYMDFMKIIDFNNQDKQQQSNDEINLQFDLAKELSSIVDFVQKKLFSDENVSNTISTTTPKKSEIIHYDYFHPLQNWSEPTNNIKDVDESRSQKIMNDYERPLLIAAKNESLSMINVNEMINEILQTNKKDSTITEHQHQEENRQVPSQNENSWSQMKINQIEEQQLQLKESNSSSFPPPEQQQSIPFSKRYKLKLKSPTNSVDKDLTKSSSSKQDYNSQSYGQENYFDDDNFINGHIVTANHDIPTNLYDRILKKRLRQDPQQNQASTIPSSLNQWLGHQHHSNHLSEYDDNIGQYVDIEQDYFYNNLDPTDELIDGWMENNELNFESYGNDLFNFDGYLINIPKKDELQDLSRTSTSLNLNKNSSNNIYDMIDIKFKLENRSLVPDNDTKPVQKPCAFYLENACARVDCKFSHDLSSIPCKYYNEGACYKEDFCPFLHDKPKSEHDQNENDANSSSSRLDPNAKSFQFKIESDSDFPSLFDDNFEMKTTETKQQNNESRVNFVFKNSKSKDNTHNTSSSSNEQNQSEIIGRSAAGRNLTKLNLNDIHKLSSNPNRSNLQNFAKCFDEKIEQHNKSVNNKVRSKIPETEEEWPSLSGHNNNNNNDNKSGPIGQSDKFNNKSPSKTNSKQKYRSKESSISNNNNNNNLSKNFRDKVLMKTETKILNRKNNTRTTLSNDQNQQQQQASSSNTINNNGNKLRNYSSLKSILNA